MNTNSGLFAASLQEQYTLLIHQGFKLSLSRSMECQDIDVIEFCKGFRPHPYKEILVKWTTQYAIDHGIWLEQFINYITCAIYLFPKGKLLNVAAIVENCGVDFYLNDTIGRERYIHLSIPEKRYADTLVARLLMVDVNLTVPEILSGVERANIATLEKIKTRAQSNWFVKFLKLYNYHLETAHRDCERDANHIFYSVNEYIEIRNHISGMPHTVELIEFAEDRYIDQEFLIEVGLSESLEKLKNNLCLFGCLSNDLFSFERECIDQQSLSNLIAVYALNNPSMDLQEILQKCAEMVGHIFQQAYMAIMNIRKHIDRLLHEFEPQKHSLETGKIEDLGNYLDSMEYGLKASWAWQIYTPRYKRPNSIWQETTLASLESSAA